MTAVNVLYCSLWWTFFNRHSVRLLVKASSIWWQASPLCQIHCRFCPWLFCLHTVSWQSLSSVFIHLSQTSFVNVLNHPTVLPARSDSTDMHITDILSSFSTTSITDCTMFRYIQDTSTSRELLTNKQYCWYQKTWRHRVIVTIES